MINFTNCKEELNNYKGSEKKKTLIYENKKYLVKFPDPIREKNKKRRGVNYASSFSLDGSAGRSVRVTRSIRFLCTSVTLKWAPSQ